MSHNKKFSYPLWLYLLDGVTYFFRRSDYQVKRESTNKFESLELHAYDEWRDHFKSGDLFFCGGNHPLSKVIRYFSGKSWVSHVGIIFRWQDRVMLMESVHSDGVRIIPLSQYVEDYENKKKPYDGRIYIARHSDIHRNNEGGSEVDGLSNQLVDTLIKRATSLLNKDFSLKDFAAFFRRASTGKGKHLRDDHFLCSEFVERCFRKGIGITFPDDGAGFVAPEHIASDEKVEALVEINTAKGGSSFSRL